MKPNAKWYGCAGVGYCSFSRFLSTTTANDPKGRFANQIKKLSVESRCDAGVAQSKETVPTIDDVFPMQNQRIVGVVGDMAMLEGFEFVVKALVILPAKPASY